MSDLRRKIHSSDFLIDRPFGEDSEVLLREWFEAAALYLIPSQFSREPEGFRAQVNECFQSLINHNTNHDQHLFRAVPPLLSSLRSGRKRGRASNTAFTRAFALLNGDFLKLGRSEADLLSDHEELYRDGKVRVHSPLYFIRRILTADDYLASEAYAHAIIRAEIFSSTVRTFSQEIDTNPYAFIADAISFKSISASLNSIQSYLDKRDNIYPTSAAHFIVCHLLASQGYAVLVFNPPNTFTNKARGVEKDYMPIDEFLQAKTIDQTDRGYEFRILPNVDVLPSAAQLLSELDGVPIAIPGMRTVFSGGIRSTAGSGAVIRITGKSGSGKTTLALAACAALAPLGTKAFYLSCEEEGDDLIDRIYSVTPSFISNTKGYVPPAKGDDASWFSPFHLAGNDPDSNLEAASSFIDEVLGQYKEQGLLPSDTRPPGVAPLLIVLDGVHELIGRNTGDPDKDIQVLHDLIDRLRRLNALVILLSADIDAPALRAIDYLVDVVVSLEDRDEKHDATNGLRQFRLQKTRRQFSHSGNHKYHISRSGGARVFPSMPAILDSFKRYRWQEADQTTCFDFLLGFQDGDEERPWLRIFTGSHVLITGRGSSGKASFALRLLTSPHRAKNTVTADMFRPNGNSPRSAWRRILVVSFLYPKTYYDALIRRMQRTKFRDRRYNAPAPQIAHTVLSFYPGNMPPEVLVAKITEELRRGEVQGVPYDSVLIDGLHNVFLQFPVIESDTLIWPILSELFRRCGVSVVTTHAHFDVIGMEDDPNLGMDVRSMANRSTPLLQSLVNSADYYLDVSPLEEVEDDPDGDPASGGYALIKVGTALGQPLPRARHRLWNRVAMTVMRPGDAGFVSGDAIR